MNDDGMRDEAGGMVGGTVGGTGGGDAAAGMSAEMTSAADGASTAVEAETVALADLPRGSRIWVFASVRPFTADDEARLTSLVRRVFGVWVRKSPGVRGASGFRDGHFLIVGADERGACVSGCGIDAMMQWVRQLEREAGLRLVDRMQVYWRDAAGAVRSADRAEFKRLRATGEIGPSTRVFDTAAARSDVLADGRFELPLPESWHSQI